MPGSPRASGWRPSAPIARKLDKRQRQHAERLRTGGSTVVTLPTAMVAELLGQVESSTRAQITRVRQELADLLSRDSGRRDRAEDGTMERSGSRRGLTRMGAFSGRRGKCLH